jgi:nickel/cobalt transporter (NicO) family protein
MIRLFWICPWLLAAFALLTTGASRADTVASLLGNFTINQFSGLILEPGTLEVHYVVVFGQLPALRELHNADADGNGITTQEERDAHVARLAGELTRGLEASVDGKVLPLRAARWSSSLPTEQGGFSLRVDLYLDAALPNGSIAAPRILHFANRNYDGRIGWNEIAVQATHGMAAFNGNAFGNSLTNALTDALQSLPQGGPLSEREVQVQFATGALPAAAHALPLRPGTTGTAARAGENSWLARQTRGLIETISAASMTPGMLLLCVIGALLLGAVHALSPGHGKTLVGAYLIGSRGTARHAAFLGATVTLTHTAGVFILGFATLSASRFIVAERLLPILSAASALLVLGMGSVLLVQRALAARRSTPIFYPMDRTWHSHGGPMHSHLAPDHQGQRLTWTSLLALGISGGLVPCPSALVLLLAAVALNKTAAGMLLVLAFSIGLAMTLTAVGLAFLYARNRFPRLGANARWPHLLPILSSGAITVIGILLCAGAVQSFK